MAEAQPRTPLPFLDRGIAQVGVIVKDLEGAMETYWRMFGVVDWQVYTYGKPLVKHMSYRGKPAEYRMRIALGRAGPTQFELIEMVEGDTIYADFVKEHGFGVHHLGVLVDDMDAALADAARHGLTVTQDGGGHGLDGDGAYAYLDTEKELGVTLELIQRPARRAEPDAVFPPRETTEGSPPA